MNNKLFILCLCLLSYAIVIPLTLFAASFDCGKAKSEVEKLICNNEELSKLDESLNDAYLKALNRIDIKTAMIESQNQWLKKERDICQDAECIKRAYENRIKELGFSSSYGIVFFRDKNQKTSIPEDSTNLAKQNKIQQLIENDQTKYAQQRASLNDSHSNTPIIKKVTNHKRKDHVLAKNENAVSSIKKIDRPKLMSELLYSTSDYKTSPRNELVWSKLLLDLKIPDYSPQVNSEDLWRNSCCNYMNAIATLQEIQSQLGKNSPYLKVWAANQDRVLMACQGKPEHTEPPIKPAGKSLPRRAKSDFLYQLGSWNFYRGNYEAALTNYQSAEKLIGTGQRAKAAYMVVRTLAYLNRAEDAYHKIGKILEDHSLREVHDIAKNYRFVIMSNSRSFNLDLTPELAIEHLNWLQKIVKLNTETLQQPDKAFAEQKDAFEQLDAYFPLYEPDSKAVDWWLTSENPTSPKMQAVKTLAPKNPLIDWMQAKWAHNVFDSDWLWALHDKDNPYWEQNRNIVIHALEKWKSNKDGVWLQIAIRRVHPQDSMALEILSAAEPFLDFPWRTETPEYRLWLFDIWENAIRIHLGRDNFNKSVTLVSNHLDFYGWGLTSFPERQNYYDESYKDILAKMLRWLIYTGQFEHARTFLNIVQKQHQGEFYQWRSLLATNVVEAISVAIKQHTYSNNYENDEVVWQEMLNLLPDQALYSIATDERIEQTKRALIARTLFTRAILLNYDNEQIDKSAALAGKLNPSIREQLLESVSGHNRDKYIGFLLKMPRFRPAIYLEYADDPEKRGEEKVPAIDAIDRYNHNDNNWWCEFDDKMFEKRIFNSMKIVPSEDRLLSLNTTDKESDQSDRENNETNQNATDELKPYLDNQRRLFAQHPYMTLIDRKEIEALKSIPSGPQYLSEAVIKRELEGKPAKSSEEQNERAANLHRAVRTTRYGCNRNCSHGEYSKQAFTLLHKYYENTPWAKATPYWFD